MNLASSLFNPATEARVTGEGLRVSLARIVIAWGFGSVFFNTLGGAIYTVWVRKFSMDDRIFGALAALLPFMSFLQVISARRIEKHGHRKRTMIVNGLIGRSLWLVAAMAPLTTVYFPGTFSQAAVFNFILICIAASGVFQALAGPAFFSWMSDLVPERVQPAFFARRLQVGTVAAIGAAFFGGLLADHFPRLDVLCWILALASVAGLVDIAFFFGVIEPPMTLPVDEDGAHRPSAPFWQSLREPLRDPTYRTFLVFVGLLMFSIGLQGAFLWLHCLENLHYSKTITGIVVNIAPLLGMVWSVYFWRRLIVTHGTRPVMRINAVAIVFIPIAWLMAGPGEWPTLAFITFLSGAMYAALDLSNQTLLTSIAPQFPRPTLIALFSIAAGVSLAMASMLGGFLAQFLRGYEWEIVGVSILNYHVLFLCSMLVRVVNAFVIAPQLREPDSTATLETVKDVIPELAQSMADLLTRPVARGGK